MSVEASVRELLGAFIGKQLGLAVVEPVLIEVIPAFAETLKGGVQHRAATSSLGLNYGSVYMGSKLDFIRGQALSEPLMDEAARVFAFDVLISNADRRVDKPNMFTDGSRIYLFDHELAFGFIYEVFKNREPWHIRPQDLEWIQNHYFYSYLQAHPVSLTTFTDRLEQLSEAFWRRAASLIPASWMNNQFGFVHAYLNQIVTNRIVFQQEIERILS
jgi:hypothetical protein